MSNRQQTRAQIQKLLNENMQIQGEIKQLDEKIGEYEDSLIGSGWTEGNIKVGWQRADTLSKQVSATLSNRDRIFSLSSITSQASLHLSPIENENTVPNDGARFYKKKITKKTRIVVKKRKTKVPRKVKSKRGRPRKRNNRRG